MLAATFHPAPPLPHARVFGADVGYRELSGVFDSLAWLVGAVVVTGLVVVGGTVVYRNVRRSRHGLGDCTPGTRVFIVKDESGHTDQLSVFQDRAVAQAFAKRNSEGNIWYSVQEEEVEHQVPAYKPYGGWGRTGTRNQAAR